MNKQKYARVINELGDFEPCTEILLQEQEKKADVTIERRSQVRNAFSEGYRHHRSYHHGHSIANTPEPNEASDAHRPEMDLLRDFRVSGRKSPAPDFSLSDCFPNVLLSKDAEYFNNLRAYPKLHLRCPEAPLDFEPSDGEDLEAHAHLESHVCTLSGLVGPLAMRERRDDESQTVVDVCDEYVETDAAVELTDEEQFSELEEEYILIQQELNDAKAATSTAEEEIKRLSDALEDAHKDLEVSATFIAAGNSENMVLVRKCVDFCANTVPICTNVKYLLKTLTERITSDQTTVEEDITAISKDFSLLEEIRNGKIVQKDKGIKFLRDLLVEYSDGFPVRHAGNARSEEYQIIRNCAEYQRGFLQELARSNSADAPGPIDRDLGTTADSENGDLAADEVAGADKTAFYNPAAEIGPEALSDEALAGAYRRACEELIRQNARLRRALASNQDRQVELIRALGVPAQ